MLDQYKHKLSNSFTHFFESEKSSGIFLILCTIIALTAANSNMGTAYLHVWHTPFLGMSLEHWINDGLMAIFFLLIGLELERELYSGELAHFKTALLPAVAAVGGVCVPVLIHFALNAGTPYQAGAAIPMATDIAFALGVLALLGSRIPLALKVFLTALAVIDDLLAIIVIGVFYSANLAWDYLGGALAIFALLVVLNRYARVMALLPYLIGGVLMWFCMLKSGVHATIAGVLLAFAIPFTHKQDDHDSPSHKLEHCLHKPVAFIILPLFALANTGILIESDWWQSLQSSNSLGIMAGLVLGKPLGILIFTMIVVALGICTLPQQVKLRHIMGAGILGGIGYTMSIFITNLAFTNNAELINSAKIAILVASLLAGILGFLWLHFACKSK